MNKIKIMFASGGQGALLKNRPLDPRKTFDSPSGDWFIVF
jgi:hypothetical protein